MENRHGLLVEACLTRADGMPSGWPSGISQGSSLGRCWSGAPHAASTSEVSRGQYLILIEHDENEMNDGQLADYYAAAETNPVPRIDRNTDTMASPGNEQPGYLPVQYVPSQSYPHNSKP